jgi:hypothetical protein
MPNRDRQDLPTNVIGIIITRRWTTYSVVQLKHRMTLFRLHSN